MSVLSRERKIQHLPVSFLHMGRICSLFLGGCKRLNSVSSRDCKESRSMFQRWFYAWLWGRINTEDFFLKNDFSPLINVSLHLKFSFSLCLLQIYEKSRAGQERRVGELGSHCYLRKCSNLSWYGARRLPPLLSCCLAFSPKPPITSAHKIKWLINEWHPI